MEMYVMYGLRCFGIYFLVGINLYPLIRDAIKTKKNKEDLQEVYDAVGEVIADMMTSNTYPIPDEITVVVNDKKCKISRIHDSFTIGDITDV